MQLYFSQVAASVWVPSSLHSFAAFPPTLLVAVLCCTDSTLFDGFGACQRSVQLLRMNCCSLCDALVLWQDAACPAISRDELALPSRHVQMLRCSTQTNHAGQSQITGLVVWSPGSVRAVFLARVPPLCPPVSAPGRNPAPPSGIWRREHPPFPTTWDRVPAPGITCDSVQQQCFLP